MPNVEKSSKAIDSNEREGILEEYKMLRDELISAKARRLQTVSLTVGAVGVILSIIAGAVLGSNIPSADIRLALSIGGSVALYGILIPSQIMIIHLQQTIQRIGSYIRIYIEPLVPGLNWESRWSEHKFQNRLPKGLRGISSIYFFLSLLPLLLPFYVISQGTQNWLLILVLTPFVLWSLYLSYDIQAAFSRGWKWQWQSEAKKLSYRKKSSKLNRQQLS